MLLVQSLGGMFNRSLGWWSELSAGGTGSDTAPKTASEFSASSDGFIPMTMVPR